MSVAWRLDNAKGESYRVIMLRNCPLTLPCFLAPPSRCKTRLEEESKCAETGQCAHHRLVVLVRRSGLDSWLVARPSGCLGAAAAAAAAAAASLLGRVDVCQKGGCLPAALGVGGGDDLHGRYASAARRKGRQEGRACGVGGGNDFAASRRIDCSAGDGNLGTTRVGRGADDGRADLLCCHGHSAALLVGYRAGDSHLDRGGDFRENFVGLNQGASFLVDCSDFDRDKGWTTGGRAGRRADGRTGGFGVGCWCLSATLLL